MTLRMHEQRLAVIKMCRHQKKEKEGEVDEEEEDEEEGTRKNRQ